MNRNKLAVKALSGVIGVAATVLLLWLVQYEAVQLFFVALFFAAVAWQFAKLAYELMTDLRGKRAGSAAEPVYKNPPDWDETPANALLRKLSDDFSAYFNEMVNHPPEDVFIKADEIAAHSHLFNYFRYYYEDRTPEEISDLNRYRHPLDVLCNWFAYEERDGSDWRNTMNHIVWNICSKRDDKDFELEDFAQENG